MADAETPVSELPRERLEEIAREYRELQDEFADFRDAFNLIETTVWDLQDFIVGEWSPSIAENELQADSVFDAIQSFQELDGLEEKLREEQKLRSQKISNLNRKIELIAEDCDVNLSDSRLRGHDKIIQVMRHGPEEVESRVYSKHERGRDILVNAGDWGSILQDANGRRFTISAGEAKERLRDKRGENLQSGQVTRAFEAIEEWGSEARHVKISKNADGEKQLTLYIDDGSEDGETA